MVIYPRNRRTDYFKMAKRRAEQQRANKQLRKLFQSMGSRECSIKAGTEKEEENE